MTTADQARREETERQQQILRDRLVRIRALLKSAEDPSYPAEIQAQYNAKAAELLASYGIDRATLFEDDPTSDVLGDLIIHVPDPFFLQKQVIAAVVAKQFNCRALIRRRSNEIHLFGFESDLERVEVLFTSLLIQASTAINGRVPGRGHTAANYRRSFLLGFAAEIGRRLKAANQTAQNNAPASSTGRSTDLVLASRKDQVDQRVKEMFPKLGKASEMTFQRDRWAERDGAEAGARADLGQTRLRSRTNNPALPRR